MARRLKFVMRRSLAPHVFWLSGEGSHGLSLVDLKFLFGFRQKTKLVKRRLTLFASRRRDKLRRALGRWQALSAACNARLASIETVEASLQAAEQRREGAVALARALTARVDAATVFGTKVK